MQTAPELYPRNLDGTHECVGTNLMSLNHALHVPSAEVDSFGLTLIPRHLRAGLFRSRRCAAAEQIKHRLWTWPSLYTASERHSYTAAAMARFPAGLPFAARFDERPVPFTRASFFFLEEFAAGRAFAAKK